MEVHQTRYAIGNDMWVRVQNSDTHTVVLARFGPDHSDRLRVREMYLETDDDQPLLGEELRAVSIAQLEAFANEPDTRKDLERRATTGIGPPLRLLAREVSTSFGSKPIERGHWLPRAIMDTSPPEPSRLPARPPPANAETFIARFQPPQTKPYPTEFYEQIADAYLTLAQVTSQPARKIADDSDVPIATVRGWIKACRQRGLLAPGRAGRAG